MRFKLGMAVGFAAGYWVATTSSEDRRAKLDEMWTGVRDNPRVQRMSETVTRDARRLGDVVEQRVAKVTTGAVGTVERSGTSTSETSPSSPSGTSSTGPATPSQTKSA